MNYFFLVARKSPVKSLKPGPKVGLILFLLVIYNVLQDVVVPPFGIEPKLRVPQTPELTIIRRRHPLLIYFLYSFFGTRAENRTQT